MASNKGNVVKTFMDMTGASREVALKRIYDHRGDINEALNSHFGEGDIIPTNLPTVSSSQCRRPEDAIEAQCRQPELNLSSLLKPDSGRSFLEGSSVDFSAGELRVTHPREDLAGPSFHLAEFGADTADAEHAVLLSLKVDAVLNKENYTLEELLKEDGILQEYKALNGRLIQFLREKPQVEQLLRYIANEDSRDAVKNQHEKVLSNACEIIRCEADNIIQSLAKDEKLMRLLFSYLEPNHSHNSLSSAYFGQTVASLISRDIILFMDFFHAHQGLLRHMINLIGITSIMEVFIHLLMPDKHTCTNYMKAMQWSENTNILEMIVDKFLSSDSPEVHANAGTTLIRIIKRTDIYAKISSPRFIQRLLRTSLQEEGHESVLVHSLSLCIALLDAQMSSSCPVSENIALLDTMLESLRDFIMLLDVSRVEIISKKGEMESVLPFIEEHQLKIVEFISVLLSTGHEGVENEVIKQGGLRCVLDLLPKYPLSKVLHHHVHSIISSCFKRRNGKLVEHLIEDCDLVEQVVSAEKHYNIADKVGKVLDVPNVKNRSRASPGNHQVKVMDFAELVRALLSTRNKGVVSRLIHQGAIRRVIELLSEYPLLNSLHYCMDGVIELCFKRGRELVEHLIGDCGLYHVLIKARSNYNQAIQESEAMLPCRRYEDDLTDVLREIDSILRTGSEYKGEDYIMPRSGARFEAILPELEQRYVYNPKYLGEVIKVEGEMSLEFISNQDEDQFCDLVTENLRSRRKRRGPKVFSEEEFFLEEIRMKFGGVERDVVRNYLYGAFFKKFSHLEDWSENKWLQRGLSIQKIGWKGFDFEKIGKDFTSWRVFQMEFEKGINNIIKELHREEVKRSKKRKSSRGKIEFHIEMYLLRLERLRKNGSYISLKSSLVSQSNYFAKFDEQTLVGYYYHVFVLPLLENFYSRIPLGKANDSPGYDFL